MQLQDGSYILFHKSSNSHAGGIVEKITSILPWGWVFLQRILLGSGCASQGVCSLHICLKVSSCERGIKT